MLKPIILISALIFSIPGFAQNDAVEKNGALSDPQIAHIVVTANQVDVDAGKFAESRSKNAEVRKFARQMVTDHSAAVKQAGELTKKLKITPEDNKASENMKTGGEENLTNLRKLKGKEFDKSYIDHEVVYHQAVLDAIDRDLMPNAKNAELKSLLEKTRPVIEAHLKHAKEIQAKLEH